MGDAVDRLLGLSADELKRWNSRRRGRGRYLSRERRGRSKEELASYLVKNGFKSRKSLRAGRREGDPTDDDYVSAYGSWRAAVAEIWRSKPLDRQYVVKSILEFKLWTKRAYRAARSRRPDVFPSLHAVEREFGCWGILKQIATAMSFKKTLAAYMELKRRLGRKPSAKDCLMAGIIIEGAIKLHGGKKGFDRFIEAMEEMI